MRLEPETRIQPGCLKHRPTSSLLSRRSRCLSRFETPEFPGSIGLDAPAGRVQYPPMTRVEFKEQALAQLSPEERVALAVDLWDSVEPGDIGVPDWHLEIVRERLAEDERDPEAALPGEELLAWLRQPRT